MANPGAWVKTDTNEFRNERTGDRITLEKKRSVYNDPSTRSWKIYMNGEKTIDLRDHEVKEDALRKAKSLMEGETAEKQRETEEKNREKEEVIKEAIKVAESRSERARSVDRNQRADKVLDPGDVDDLRTWIDNPSRYDLSLVDTKNASARLKEIYPKFS